MSFLPLGIPTNPYRGLPKAFRRIVENRLPGLTPHKLRHAFSGAGEDVGLSVPTIGCLLGHAGHGVTAGLHLQGRSGFNCRGELRLQLHRASDVRAVERDGDEEEAPRLKPNCAPERAAIVVRGYLPASKGDGNGRWANAPGNWAYLALPVGSVMSGARVSSDGDYSESRHTYISHGFPVICPTC